MKLLRTYAPYVGLVRGSVLVGLGIINLSGSIASASWLPEVAVITRATVDTASPPSVEYRYLRQGQPYTSTRIRFGFTTSPSAVRKLVARYSVGDSVTAYVDPRNPERAVLQHNGLLIPVAELVVGFLLLSLWLRAPRRPKGHDVTTG